MRNIFLALLLANLAFAAWHVWFSDSPRPVRPDDSGLPPITLVKELPTGDADSQAAAAVAEAPGVTIASSEGQAATAPSGVSPGAAEEPRELAATAAARRDDVAPPAAPANGEQPASRCSSIGPFRELSQAATAAANLRGAGYQPTQRVAEGNIWIGYWVYIDALATEKEASEVLEKVRTAGIADSYVIPNSDSGNRVSLGVFSEIAGVSKQREKVRGLGYEPKVVDRTRRATVYWVDVLLTGDQVLDFDTLQTPGRIIRLEQRACEAPSA